MAEDYREDRIVRTDDGVVRTTDDGVVRTTEVRREPDRDYDRRDGGGAGRTVLILLAVVALIAVVTYALGLWSLDTSGKLSAPTVHTEVTGGSVPNVDVNTGSIDVGTKTETVKVPEVSVGSKDADVKLPTVSVTPAENDGKAEK